MHIIDLMFEMIQQGADPESEEVQEQLSTTKFKNTSRN